MWQHPGKHGVVRRKRGPDDSPVFPGSTVGRDSNGKHWAINITYTRYIGEREVLKIDTRSHLKKYRLGILF